MPLETTFYCRLSQNLVGPSKIPPFLVLFGTCFPPLPKVNYLLMIAIPTPPANAKPI